MVSAISFLPRERDRSLRRILRFGLEWNMRAAFVEHGWVVYSVFGCFLPWQVEDLFSGAIQCIVPCEGVKTKPTTRIVLPFMVDP